MCFFWRLFKLVRRVEITRFYWCRMEEVGSLKSEIRRLNASATFPLAKLAPFCGVPSLLPWMSFAFPSPGHQLTISGGGWVHVCATALLVASSPRTAALVSNQDASAPLAFRFITPFVLLCRSLIDASFCSARCIRWERLFSAGCSMWGFPVSRTGKGRYR